MSVRLEQNWTAAVRMLNRRMTIVNVELDYTRTAELLHDLEILDIKITSQDIACPGFLNDDPATIVHAATVYASRHIT